MARRLPYSRSLTSLLANDSVTCNYFGYKQNICNIAKTFGYNEIYFLRYLNSEGQQLSN
jgi:hypothetical protein